ncbi:hypothetical protein EV421DRAFT_1813183 [Armillaria borealis]|uniref:Uncharacterized protein n=1 Tax=Armillaria borealis TaxID=47425 RepID=A0AA39JG40_9AGAR|nr:hypothetical protein EV421DRAFT_1813183 [Armillaria borealis]
MSPYGGPVFFNSSKSLLYSASSSSYSTILLSGLAAYCQRRASSSSFLPSSAYSRICISFAVFSCSLFSGPPLFWTRVVRMLQLSPTATPSGEL